MFVCFFQHENFEEKMQGMRTQLIQLSTLLRLLDLAFWNYLGQRFCFSTEGHRQHQSVIYS